MSKQKLATLSSKYNIQAIFLFGSQAAKCARKDSDYDIAVLNSKKLSRQEENTLLTVLSKAIGLPRQRLDISWLQHASPLLQSQVARYGQPLYGQRSVIDKFRIYAEKQWQDNTKFQALQQAYINKNI